MIRRLVNSFGALVRQTLRTRAAWTNPLAAVWFFYRSARSPFDRTMVGRFRHRGLPLVCRRIDFCAVNEITVHREYDFLQPYFQTADSLDVLDLGANIGLFALQVFAFCPGSRVVSLEPSADTFEILRHNQALNEQFNWVIHRAAVWRSGGYVSFENRRLSTGSRACEDDQGDERVPAFSLRDLFNQFVDRSVDLLKLDIEGSEQGVLEAGEAQLERVRLAVVEIHPELCNVAAVRQVLDRCFAHLYRTTGRQSSKPLIVASRQPLDWSGMEPYAPADP